MKSPKTIRRGALAAIAVALLTAAPASAALPDAAVSCRAAVAKSYSKLLKTAVKTISGCHKARDKGDLTLTATDCNDITMADAANGKYAGAVTKHEAAVAAACVGVDADLIQPDGPTDFYTSCPVTCAGVADPMTTMAHVATCQGCEAGAIAGDAFEATLGLPAQGSQSAENQKCRGAIGKGYGKYLSTFVKGATGCQGDQDEIDNNSLSFCEVPANNDPKGKASGALTKAAEGLDKSCVGVDLAVMAGCATDNLTNLKTCTATEWDGASDDSFSTTYEMPATGCPDVIRIQIRGGCTVNPLTGESSGNCSSGSETGTQLSVGWIGLAHGKDITDSYQFSSEITCPGTVRGACGNCTIDRISDDNPQYAAFQRCLGAPEVPCTHAAFDDVLRDADPTCTVSGKCRYYLGPPLALSAAGTPTCALNVMTTDFNLGTANPDTGESSITVDLRAIVHLGVTLSRPCAICTGDAIPQDGLQGGTCLGGVRNGQPCDVQGFDLSFAPTNADNPTSGNSLDCPPPNTNVSGEGLAVTLPLTTGTSSKSTQDACEAPLGTLDCFCGVCSGDNTKSCETDLECSNLALGSCTQGNGVDRRPNNCSDGYCMDTVPAKTDRGECSGGPQHCIDGPNIDDLCAIDSECSVCLAGPDSGLPCTDDTECDDAFICDGGFDDGNSCVTNLDCAATVCTGGVNDGLSCTTDLDCPVVCNGGFNDGDVCTGNPSCAAKACVAGVNIGLSCTTNPDCPGSFCAAGTCPTQETCEAGTCIDTAVCDLHTCGFEEDSDTFCSGVLLASGLGIIPCSSDATCESYNNTGVCPGEDCGTCSVSAYRSCFLDPIEVSGVPDTANPTLVATFCLPPSGNGTVNAASGTPGPGSVQTDAVVELRYH